MLFVPRYYGSETHFVPFLPRHSCHMSISSLPILISLRTGNLRPIAAMNEHLDWKNKITFNISSSTPPQDVFDTITQGSQTANLDCMLCISVFYNRQGFDTDRPERITPHLHLAPDYLHNVSERPRQLLGYDVCLKPSDNDWHIPLIVRTSAYSTRNKRTRGQFSQDLRYQRYRICCFTDNTV